jgi:two-component system, OmpR family, sensor histidine kinase KdpD
MITAPFTLREYCGVTRKPSLISGIVAALVSVAVITGLIYALKQAVPVVSTGVVYMLAVLLVSSRWGPWLGVATAVLSALAFNFFHIPPTGRFTIAEGENWVALGVFVVAALVTSTLAGMANERAQEAERGRNEADLTAEMARLLLGGGRIEDSLRAVGQRIAEAYELPSVSVELSWVDSDRGRRAVPLIVDGNRIGTVLVPSSTEPAVLDALQDRLVPALETLVGAARRRDELEGQLIETKALRRSNVVKTTLLRTVSHDLRSPLTAITTAASGLDSDNLDEEQRRELTSVITTESARLSRLVDNLLDLTRIQAGSAEPRPDWCSIDEIVQGAIESVSPPPAGFDVRLDPDLPLVQADAAQLERALANVLENSSHFAGEYPVVVRGRASGRFIILRVTDQGPGIRSDELERVFEPFYRSREPFRGGSGLGLAIARGFLEANGGRIRAESLPGQGTSFVIQIPIPVESPSPPRAEELASE